MSWTVDAPRTQVSISRNHLNVNGRGFFPFGFYHISWADGGTPEQRATDMKAMSEAGFNVILTEPIHDTAREIPPLLDLAHQDKMMVIAHGIPPAFVSQIARAPALLGFTLMDDSNYNSTPQAVNRLQSLYRAKAPEKMTNITLALAVGRPEAQFFGVSDAVSNMSYPIGGTDELGVVYSVMRLTVQQAEQKGLVPLASLQTFAWPQKRDPTYTEVRNMTYQALMAGIKGIVYYSYRSTGHQITNNPDLWSATRTLAGEVKQLAPTLLEGQRTEFYDQDKNPKIITVAFRGATSYLMALNSSPKAQPLQVQLSNVHGIHPISNTNKLTFQRGHLSGILQPLDVQVFEIW